MKKLKLMLPMLAFVLAIGMSFAFTNATEEGYYVTKYIHTDNGWRAVEVACTNGESLCQVIFEDDLSQEPYPVYDQMGDKFPSAGNGQIIKLPGDVPGL